MRGEKLHHRYEERDEDVRDVFDRDGVVAAYIFGSAVTGEAGPLSDLDFSVYFDDASYMDVLNDLLAILGDDIDVVHMNEAETLLNFHIIRDGAVLYERSREERVLLESRIMQQNMDVQYYRDRYVKANLERVKERGLA